MHVADFHGAKLILRISGRIVVLERDAVPGIRWPGWLDLPGGGRDPGEMPEQTVLREVREEISLSLRPGALRRRFCRRTRHGVAWTFVAQISERHVARLRPGSEGQRILLMPADVFAAHPRAVPALRRVVARHLRQPKG